MDSLKTGMVSWLKTKLESQANAHFMLLLKTACLISSKLIPKVCKLIKAVRLEKV